MRVLAATAIVMLAGCGNSPQQAPPADLAAAPSSDAALAAADTWTNFAQGFFATYCVRCHTTGNLHRDYNQLAQVMRDAQLIACGVTPSARTGCNPSVIAPAQFPIGGGPFPSDAERTRLVHWIDAGLAQ